MQSRLMVTGIVTAVLAGAAWGCSAVGDPAGDGRAGSSPDREVTEEACLVNGLGNKLCGEDAAAWCSVVLDGVDDVKTVEACASVGVAPPSEPENADERDPAYVPPDGTYAPNGDGDGDGTSDGLEREIDEAVQDSCRVAPGPSCYR